MNIDTYRNENGDLAVLFFMTDGLYDKNADDLDYSINLDKRLIEYALSGSHTYKEWDDKISECGYNYTIKDQIGYRLSGEDYEHDVNFYPCVKYVPKGKFFRIETEDEYDDYGKWIGFCQVVSIYNPEEFIMS